MGTVEKKGVWWQALILVRRERIVPCEDASGCLHTQSIFLFACWGFNREGQLVRDTAVYSTITMYGILEYILPAAGPIPDPGSSGRQHESRKICM